MRLFRRPRPGACAVPGGCAATIGVFDGVHLGHRRILAAVVAEARRLGVPALVFSFEPTPQEVMNRTDAPARLMRLREKAAALAGAGVDLLYAPPFSREMQQLEPGEFIEHLLVRTLAVRHLVVGNDFRFARGRSGGLDDLQQGGRSAGFTVEQLGAVDLGGARVSSTAIRAALASGDLDAATRLLGRPFRISGRVRPGRQLGRQLGFPTANLGLRRRRSPVHGIFAVRVHGLEPGPLDGVASVGTRPTVDGVEPLVEVHVFDYRQQFYGRLIHVDFVARLRDEERFDDLDALRRQMERDAEAARHTLRRFPA
jgi:riboflavin kinase/FMN adenylyltransferase